MYVWLPAGEDADAPAVFETVDLEGNDADGAAPPGELLSSSPRGAHAALGESYELPAGAPAAQTAS